MNALDENTLPLLDPYETTVWTASEEDRGVGALSSTKGNLPLRRVDVTARIEGLLAEIEVEQTFSNDHDEPLEATYVFPLPERLAVQRLTLCIGPREIDGKIQERAAARREYQEAVAEGRQAAVAEEERPGVFSLRTGNIPPGETVVVRLLLAGVLPCSNHEAMFRFPLVVSPRYIPGTPLRGESVGDGDALDTDAAPDASRVSPPVLLPGCTSPVRLSLRVRLDPQGAKIGPVRSSLHAVQELRDDSGKVCILLRQQEKLDRDFILRWKLLDEAPAARLLIAPDAPGAAAGTFALTITPPSPAVLPQRPRDVVFVLDQSGSMEGWRIVAARAALARLVETLNPLDRFTIVAFQSTFQTPPAFREAKLVPADSGRRSYAGEYLHSMEARGGTEMLEPLAAAAHLLAGADAARDRILFLVTDGQVGNEPQILRTVGPQLRDVRVFTLGIGTAVNVGFLQQLAQFGGGGCELVESQDRLEAAIESIHLRIGAPAATGLSLQPSDFGVLQLVPARLPPLFAGAPTTIFGRYVGAPKAALEVLGRGPDGAPWGVQAAVSAIESKAPAAAWARGRVRELEDRFTLRDFGGRTAEEFQAELVRISVENHVLCRFTAYVAVDRERIANPGGEVKKVMQPVEPTASQGSPPQSTSGMLPPPPPYPMPRMPAPAAARAPRPIQVFGYDLPPRPAAAAGPPPGRPSTSNEAPRAMPSSIPASSPSSVRERIGGEGGATIRGKAPGEKRTDELVGLTLAWCPPGTFRMGSPPSCTEAHADEGPQVLVELKQGFWMGVYPVTQAQWLKVVGTSPWKGLPEVQEGDDFPAVHIPLDEIQEFIERLNNSDLGKGDAVRQRGLPPRFHGWKYQLPTEAQWEYACRAGSSRSYTFGGDAAFLSQCAWFAENALHAGEAFAHKAATKQPNAWGLWDLHGNVWEWCSDFYAERLEGGINPAGPMFGQEYVVRGGSWADAAANCRSARRGSRPWSARDARLGFRVVLVEETIG